MNIQLSNKAQSALMSASASSSMGSYSLTHITNCCLAVGLAVGLAFQSTLANISAGVMIVIFRPFSIGNFIEAGGVAGVAGVAFVVVSGVIVVV